MDCEMAAAARVFAIGELVEMILLELPMKDLLLSQRINRACKEAVDSSVRIQKALFFIPGLPEDTNIPNVVSRWYGWLDRDPGKEYSDGNHDDEKTSGHRVMGKLIAKQAQEWKAGQGPAVMKESGVAFNPLLVRELQLAPFRMFWAVRHEQMFDLPEYASCFRMLTTQPPISFPVSKLYWGGQYDADAKLRTYRNSCSIPRSHEGSTFRKIASLVSNAREELEKEQKMKNNRSFHKLCLIECTLTDPDSWRR